METKTFEAIIANAVAKGATKVEIHRTNAFCGCVKPGDITEVIAYKDSEEQNGNTYACVRYSLRHVFDTPTIKAEILYRERTTDKCVGYGKSKEYAYAI